MENTEEILENKVEYEEKNDSLNRISQNEPDFEKKQENKNLLTLMLAKELEKRNLEPKKLSPKTEKILPKTENNGNLDAFLNESAAKSHKNIKFKTFKFECDKRAKNRKSFYKPKLKIAKTKNIKILTVSKPFKFLTEIRARKRVKDKMTFKRMWKN
ncbi:hypothetical protein MHBO_003095 [Bonamia ostreae]|uniref:Uncharacterized protein n=1 Tax=Bonamia ostreae TaxID=126728 RepID=A0ABV2AQD9_9EUKA